MSSIRVRSTTQKIVVYSDKSVSIIHAGPVGPPGPVGPEGPEGPPGGGGLTQEQVDARIDARIGTLTQEQLDLINDNLSLYVLESTLDAEILNRTAGDTALDIRIAAIEALGSLATDSELSAMLVTILGGVEVDADTLAELKALVDLRATVAQLSTTNANLLNEANSRASGDAALSSEIDSVETLVGTKLTIPTRKTIGLREVRSSDGSPAETFMALGTGTTAHRWLAFQFVETTANAIMLQQGRDYFYDWLTFRIEILVATSGTPTAAPNNFAAFRYEHGLWTPGDDSSLVLTTSGPQTQVTLPTVANTAATGWVSLGGGLSTPTTNDQLCKVGVRRTPSDPLDPATNPVNVIGIRIVKES